MSVSTNALIFFGFWSFVYILDFFLKNNEKLSARYANFRNSIGLTISLAQIRWFTTYFNKTIIKLGSRKSRFLKIWFNIGVVFSLVLMAMSVILLIMIVENTLRQKVVDQQILTPVVPGVNLPTSQLGYYLLTLLVCGIFHELGHAIAAVGEEVRVNGFGLFLMALYPGAYVDINLVHIDSISALRQLRIFCAGVWHNIVIVLMALLVILLLPFLSMPLYTSGHGATIIHVAENSPVTGENGASVGEVIASVNGHSIRNVEEWTRFIKDAAKRTTTGFCVHHRLILQNINITSRLPVNEDNADCCLNSTNSHLCFNYNHTPRFISGHEKSHICMTARAVAEGRNCSSDSDCESQTGTKPSKSFCLVPSVDNSTWLMKVSYKSQKLPLLFLGHPYSLYYYISTSNYEPRFDFLPLKLPYFIETFCKYLVSLSGALAIINIIPCYALDGQWITEALCNCLLPLFVRSSSARNAVYTCLVTFGTLLVGSNVVIALWMLVVK